MTTVRSLAFAILATAFALSPLAAASAERAALVIGNAAYPDSDAGLPTPPGDARALAETLRRKGFAVEEAVNAGKDAMQAATDRFLRAVEPDGIALVFFSGYGIQVGRRNYLIPTDARIWSEADVARDGVSVDALLDALAKRRVAIRVSVLDASRRNPFERRFRSFSQGLAPAGTEAGTLSLSATAPGAVLNEGTGSRSPFATELVQQIEAAGQTADQAFAAVREALARKVRGAQPPALSVNLEETFSFDPDRGRTALRPRKGEGRASEPAAGDQATADQTLKDQAAREQAAKDQASREQAAKDQTAREQAARDEAARARAAQEQAARDQAARDQAAKEQAARDATARAFAAAETKGSKAAYEDFLRQNPRGPLADKARAAITRLDDEERQTAEYEDAEGVGTQASYEAFLAKHPTGPFADRARAEIDRFKTVAERRVQEERRRLAALDERISRNPRDEAAYYERGQFHAQRGDSTAAISDFDQTIRLNPTAEAFNNRCWMRAIADQLQKALGDCNEALRLRPEFVDALDSRGLVNLKSGAFRAALSDYETVLRLDPGHSSALYGRGFARLRLGDKAQAGRDIEKALAFNPQIDKEFASYGVR